jgi:hypothetical protein
MKVLSLEAARARLRPSRPMLPQPVLPPSALAGPTRAGRRASPGEDGEDRLRMRQNVAAMLVIATIVGLGGWLIESLRHYSRIQTCIEAGHGNCVPIEHRYQPSPYR